MQKKLFFISDLHLGFREVDDFHHTVALHRFLNFVASEGGELVILGDGLELLQSELLFVYSAHKPLFDHLFDLAHRTKVIYVVGNHDALVGVFLKKGHPEESRFFGSNILVSPTFEDSDLKLWAEHGHMYDIYNRKDVTSPIDATTPGDRIATALGWMERYIAPNADQFIEEAYEGGKEVMEGVREAVTKAMGAITPASLDYRGDLSEYTKAASEILQDGQYSLCLFGHTHVPLVEKLAGGYYVNTGSWVSLEHPPTYVCVTADEVILGNAMTLEPMQVIKR